MYAFCDPHCRFLLLWVLMFVARTWKNIMKTLVHCSLGRSVKSSAASFFVCKTRWHFVSFLMSDFHTKFWPRKRESLPARNVSKCMFETFFLFSSYLLPKTSTLKGVKQASYTDQSKTQGRTSERYCCSLSIGFSSDVYWGSWWPLNFPNFWKMSAYIQGTA